MKKPFDANLIALFVLAAATSGCASRTLAGSAAIPDENRAVLAAVREALERDAMHETASHLYEPFATVIASGVERREPPRFAGIGEGGRVTISELRGEVLEAMAWAVATYRWASADGRVLESGRVTLVLAPEDDGWRIRHAHSSVVPPWGNSSAN